MGWRGGSIGGNVDAEKIDRILPDRVLLFRLLKYFVIHRKYFVIVFISSVINSSSYIICRSLFLFFCFYFFFFF